MAVRNLSPAVAWVAPGIGQIGLNVLLSNLSADPLDLPSFINTYAPIAAETITLASGASSITIPDTTNTRFIVVIMPPNSTTTCTFKWNSGDTGKKINPQGAFFDTFDPAFMPTTLYYVTTAAIAGVTLLLF